MPALPGLETLREMTIFTGLTTDQLTEIHSHLHQTAFPTGSHIFTVEQPGDVVYVILNGTVKIHVEQEDGSDVIVAFRGPGDTIGEMSMVDRGGRSTSVTTVEDATLLWLDRHAFQDFLRVMPALSMNLLEIFSRRLREATEQIQVLAAQDMYGRVARLLLSFAEERGQPIPGEGLLIPFRLTQSDIADCVGASRVRVNQIIGTYKKRNIISIDPDYRITIRNKDALAQYCP